MIHISRFHICAGLLAGLLLAASCTRLPEPAVSAIPEEESALTEDSGRVRIIVTDPLTKVGGIDYNRDEKPVGRWAFFIFEHSSGHLVYRGEVTGEPAATKRLLTGQYDIEVIANYPVSGQDAVHVSSIGSREDFDALKVSLGQNALGSFVMAGTTVDADGKRIPFTVVKSEGEDAQEAGICLNRLVAKVVVSGITRNFTNPSLGAKSLTVKGIYLTNVYTQARYASDYADGELDTSRSLWYNALGWHKGGSAAVSEAVDALVSERSINRTLSQGGTADLDVSLYFFPNPTRPSTDVPSSEWTGSARCTRLVIWVQVDGRDYYYPATLPKEDAYAPIGRNSVFSVHCTLLALGSQEEDDWIPGAMEVSFKPVLKNNGGWENVYSISEES